MVSKEILLSQNDAVMRAKMRDLETRKKRTGIESSNELVSFFCFHFRVGTNLKLM